jgi:hypothetical protein
LPEDPYLFSFWACFRWGFGCKSALLLVGLEMAESPAGFDSGGDIGSVPNRCCICRPWYWFLVIFLCCSVLAVALREDVSEVVVVVCDVLLVTLVVVVVVRGGCQWWWCVVVRCDQVLLVSEV